MTKKNSLGKGLSALIREDEDDKVEDLDLKNIVANKYQPRAYFKDEALEELAKSIEENGLLQPIIVRRDGRKYEIIAGERRYRAFKSLGKSKIPAIIKDISDEESAKFALIENIQREDLNIIEEARGYKEFMDEFRLTQEDLAKLVGKSRSYIANTVRLLNLDAYILESILGSRLSPGHGKVLLGIKDVNLQVEMAKKAEEGELSVRQLEELVKKLNKEENLEKKTANKDVNLSNLELDLMEILGTKVKIKDRGNKGKIEIDYYSLDDFDRIIDKFNL